MKTVTYKRATYSIEKIGYGQYIVTKETKRGINQARGDYSFIFDWINDDSDQKLHKQALQKLALIFQSGNNQ